MSTRTDQLDELAEEFGHQTFHELRDGKRVRIMLPALFMDGFVVGAQLALVDRDRARDLVDEVVTDPSAIHAVARHVEKLRSGS